MEKTQAQIAIEDLSALVRELSARLETLRHICVAKGVFSEIEFDRVLDAVTAQGLAGVGDGK